MVVIKWGSEVEGSNTSPAVFVQYSVQKLLRFKTFQNYIVRCECDRRMLLMDVDALRGEEEEKEEDLRNCIEWMETIFVTIKLGVVNNT